MSYTASKLAVRDSFDDEDVSDDVEDEVFIRDGRNGFKLDEERGVKRPLMAPRRKTKSNQLHSEIGGRPPCRAFCAPCCYGLIALAALLGVIILVVSLVMWFPFPLDQVTNFWKVGQGQLQEGKVVPCTDLTVDDIWTRSLPKFTIESAVRLNDVNGDGVLDIIIGYGTGADGRDMPDYVCNIYFEKEPPCMGGLIALDGRTGNTLWQHWTPHSVFMVDCSADLTNDKTNDCLISGKGGILHLVNGHDGSSVWHYVDQNEAVDSQGEPLVDVYSAQFIQDLDGDGIPDIIATHTRDANSGEAGTVLVGQLLLVSGKTGKLLQSIPTPDREESYYPPQVLVQLDGADIVIFGTGGQASPGGLYTVPMHNLVNGNMLQIRTLFHDDEKGVMSPPVLADINEDGSEDIVVAVFNSVIIAFNGLTFKPIWNSTFPDCDTFSAPTPGYFNDDNIPDFLVKYQEGPGFPIYYSSLTTVLDGKTGTPLIEKPIIDSLGSQMGGLTVSVEGLGNDYILYWTANCLGHEGPIKPYTFLPGLSVQAQSRADLCGLLFNSTFSAKFVALSEHVEPPGIPVYLSEGRREEEYSNVVNASAQVEHYLTTHPDFPYVINRENKVLATKKNGFSEGAVGSTNFHHRGENSVLNSNQGKGSGYYFSDAGDYMVANRGRNRVSNDCGEQEQILDADFQGNGEYPNIRKHGSVHPVDPSWQQQQEETYNMMDSNQGAARDQDYEALYGPMIAESLGANSQGFPMDNNEENKRTVNTRVKREQAQQIQGLQQLTSLGTLAPPLWPSNRNNSIDLVLVTHWIHPAKEAQLILEKDKQCIENKKAEAENTNGKHHKLDHEAILKDCLGYKWQKQPTDPNSDIFNLNMGQATVYRLRITCNCRSVGSGEKCSSILPFKQQNWPSFMGHHGNGHFWPRPSKNLILE